MKMLKRDGANQRTLEDTMGKWQGEGTAKLCITCSPKLNATTRIWASFRLYILRRDIIPTHRDSDFFVYRIRFNTRTGEGSEDHTVTVNPRPAGGRGAKRYPPVRFRA